MNIFGGEPATSLFLGQLRTNAIQYAKSSNEATLDHQLIKTICELGARYDVQISALEQDLDKLLIPRAMKDAILQVYPEKREEIKAKIDDGVTCPTLFSRVEDSSSFRPSSRLIRLINPDGSYSELNLNGQHEQITTALRDAIACFKFYPDPQE